MKENKRERIVNLAVFQGNPFVKELLREKKLPIGSTEKEFRANIREALDSRKLTEDEIEAWLDKVEGWGDQQAYICRVPLSEGETARFRNPNQFERLVNKAGLAKLFNRSHAALLPDKRELTLIQQTQLGIRFVWHEGLPWKRRYKEKDFSKYDDELEADIYYEAHIYEWGRGVMSFAWRFDLGLAAAFIPRREAEDYATQQNLIFQTVGRVVPSIVTWPPLPIPSAIYELDEKAFKERPRDPLKRRIRSKQTDFRAEGGVVSLSSTSKDIGWQDNIPIQTVRKAVNRSGFTGGKGDFYIRLGNDAEELHVILYGKENRISFPKQMSDDTVWNFIKEINALVP
jgi:hypothetical protein